METLIIIFIVAYLFIMTVAKQIDEDEISKGKQKRRYRSAVGYPKIREQGETEEFFSIKFFKWAIIIIVIYIVIGAIF